MYIHDPEPQRSSNIATCKIILMYIMPDMDHIKES